MSEGNDSGFGELPPPPPTLPNDAPVQQPPTSPDGSITYTASDAGPTRQVFGEGPKPGPITDPIKLQSTTIRTGHTHTPRQKASRMGWFGRAFLIRAAVVAVLFLVGGSVALWNGETSASRLEPGDCFEALTEAEISTVKEQECTEPHGGEVYATISGTAAGLDARCQAAFDEGLSEGTIVLVEFPDDARFSYLQGEDDHHCLIESPSGQLVGRVSRDFDRLFGN